MALIEDKIYSVLTSVTDITDLVSTRVFPYLREQGSGLPAIVYEEVSVSPKHTKNTASKCDEYRIQFNCFATSARGAKVLANTLRTALDRYTDTDIVETTFLNSTGDYEIDSLGFVSISDYEICLKI